MGTAGAGRTRALKPLVAEGSAEVWTVPKLSPKPIRIVVHTIAKNTRQAEWRPIEYDLSVKDAERLAADLLRAAVKVTQTEDEQ